MRKYFPYGVLVIVGILTILILWRPYHWWLALIFIPLLIWGAVDYFQRGDNIRRNFPFFGSVIRFIEAQRHVLQENLLLNREEGKPFNWIQKEIVYKRATGENETQPFGTQLLYSETGREWFSHAAFPANEVEDDLRITIGGPKCLKSYSASILNIGGMSYGSISKNATLALNGGAKLGNFAQNTGEGGLTPYHKKYGADLIFQFGTGYFGCRNENGNFSEKDFSTIAKENSVKMVEVKISQGAKPGFGAILPAKKNTPDVAKFRHVEAHTEIHSPAYHSAFSNPEELAAFIAKLRDLSGGKPIGIKLCIGGSSDFKQTIQTFSRLDNYPDFITIDGAEGGSGAANMDSLHWVGMPLDEALHFANQTLVKYGLRDEIKLLAGGKIISAFDIARTLTLGADACYSARGMMFALGCVQSLKCNLDTCPTGITTMNSYREAALVVDDKKTKVANYHNNTMEGFKELLASAGLKHRRELSKDLIQRRVNEKTKVSYAELFDSENFNRNT